MSGKAAAEKLAIEATTVFKHLHRPYVALNYVIPASQRANYPPPQTLDHDTSTTIEPATPSKVTTSAVNASTTLPYVMDPNVKGIFAKGKQVVKLYKNGIVNVWKNHKQTKQIYSKLNASIPGSASAKPPGIFSQKKSFSMVTQTIIDKANIDIIQIDRLLEKQQQEATESESDKKTLNSEDQQTLNSSVAAVSYLPDLHTSLNRSEYQILKRTPSDFIKLPIFSVVFGVFFELTPLIVALFPSIVPSTCLLPYQLRKQLSNREKAIDFFKTSREQALLRSNEDGAQSTGPTRKALQYRSSTYKLSKDELHQLVRALNLVSKYIPLFFYSEKTLYKRIESYIDYLKADSYMISWSMGDRNPSSESAAADQSLAARKPTEEETKPKKPQNTTIDLAGVWGLDSRELVKACHERLIPTTYKEVSSETEKQQPTNVEKPKPFNLLKLELFLWTVNFIEGKYDAGFLLNSPRDLIDYQDLETAQKKYQEFVEQQLKISSNF